MNDNKLLLRYAQLSLESERKKRGGQAVSPADDQELKDILSRLRISHSEALERAVQLLIRGYEI